MIAVIGRVYRNNQGKPLKMAGVCLDITQRKQLEQERLQAVQQAEEKERQRAREAITHKEKLVEITDTMCHELRNPLNGLYGTVEFLQEDLEELQALLRAPSTSIQFEVIIAKVNALQEQLKTIDLGTKQEKAIVDDVLQYSKLEHEAITLVETPFDVKETITASVRMLFSQIKQKNLNIIYQLAIPDELTGTPYLLKGDSQRLSQILLNLVSNAIKFTPAKGNIKVAAEVKPLSSTETELWIAVEDSGIGIAEVECAQIFERFSQASRRTGAEYGGSGLGLATTKKLVEMMGGRIWVESQQGQGSKFSFVIKCKNLSNEEQMLWQTKLQPKSLLHTTKGEISGGEAVTPEANNMVLIVEDNLVNQKLLSKFLEKLGYGYQFACDGLQAIEKFKSFKFAAILMDIAMPNMDGIEATGEIRKVEREESLKLTPIIGLTGYVSEEYQQRALKAGMDDYLIKPFRQADIAAVLYKYLGSAPVAAKEQASPSVHQKAETPITKLFANKPQAKPMMEGEAGDEQSASRESEEEKYFETTLSVPSCNII
jgi:signal transduction histidine kinase/CheY-like chemotaxis protein